MIMMLMIVIVWMFNNCTPSQCLLHQKTRTVFVIVSALNLQIKQLFQPLKVLYFEDVDKGHCKSAFEEKLEQSVK